MTAPSRTRGARTATLQLPTSPSTGGGAATRTGETASEPAGESSSHAPCATLHGRAIHIRGTVQGVGFRPWVYRLARELGIAGSVRNDARGVQIDAFGSEQQLAAFCSRLRAEVPDGAEIAGFRARPLPPRFATQLPFSIEESSSEGDLQASIPPDLATCAACEAEVFDPSDRRHRYAFTNCTHCGPRFTITRRVPYDRAATSMARFVLCPSCRREYEDPTDRRFHAEPNACPICGPRLQVLDRHGKVQQVDDPIRAIADLLAGGEVVAIKGIGGFHLACDATSTAATEELRRRKLRDAKPFAVMVRDLAAARRLADLEPAEEELLASAQRPIVLVRLRADTALSAAVAPSLPLAGLFLPYSPLHHLLLEAAGRPLVMTSANLADEPIAYRNREAVERLGRIASAFLVHDREIVSRCDDSVARVIDGGPILLRRSRGWVPRPIRLRRPLERPILGCGADLKNTFCIAVGDCAYLGPHIGDLGTVAAYDALGEAVDHFERLLGVSPQLVAHDLHPDYHSTRFALERPGGHVAVQHHHAHLASAAAEHGLDEDVLGVVFDGTGYGTDGTAWGGEILHGGFGGFRRIATFRPVRLAGGDLAVREVWRVALALLEEAYDGAPPLDRLALFASVQPARIELVRTQLARGIAVSPARGVGRLFDAVGALILGRAVSRYEAELALRLGELADAGQPTEPPYPLPIDWDAEPWEIDPRALLRAVTDDVLAGVSAGVVARRFHQALAAATAAVLAAAAAELDRPDVVLSGGCFANPLLAAAIRLELARSAPHSPRVHLPRQVPPGDGGIALGQVMVADRLAHPPPPTESSDPRS